MQTVLENLIATVFYAPDTKLFANLEETVTTGGTVGALVRALSPGIAKARQYGRVLQEQKVNALRSQAELKVIDRVMAVVAESPLKARDPSVFEQAVVAVTSDIQAAQTLYISAHDRQDYFRSQSLELLERAERTDGFNLRVGYALDATGVEAALAGEDDLAIPLSTFAADVPPIGPNIDALKNRSPLFAGRKVVFENRRILRHLRIAGRVARADLSCCTRKSRAFPIFYGSYSAAEKSMTFAISSHKFSSFVVSFYFDVIAHWRVLSFLNVNLVGRRCLRSLA